MALPLASKIAIGYPTSRCPSGRGFGDSTAAILGSRAVSGATVRGAGDLDDLWLGLDRNEVAWTLHFNRYTRVVNDTWILLGWRWVVYNFGRSILHLRTLVQSTVRLEKMYNCY